MEPGGLQGLSMSKLVKRSSLYKARMWLDMTSQLIAAQLLTEPMMVKYQTADANPITQAQLHCPTCHALVSIWVTNIGLVSNTHTFLSLLSVCVHLVALLMVPVMWKWNNLNLCWLFSSFTVGCLDMERTGYFSSAAFSQDQINVSIVFSLPLKQSDLWEAVGGWHSGSSVRQSIRPTLQGSLLVWRMRIERPINRDHSLNEEWF